MMNGLSRDVGGTANVYELSAQHMVLVGEDGVATRYDIHHATQRGLESRAQRRATHLTDLARSPDLGHRGRSPQHGGSAVDPRLTGCWQPAPFRQSLEC